MDNEYIDELESPVNLSFNNNVFKQNSEEAKMKQMLENIRMTPAFKDAKKE